MLQPVRSRRALSTGGFLLLLCLLWVGAFAAPVAGWWGVPHARPYTAGGRFLVDTNLLSKSDLSAWAIDRYLAAYTPLPPLGAAFMKAERRYGINARYLVAHAMLESGFGTSDIARNAHNLFGYHAFDRDPWRYASRFRTYQEGIDKIAHRIRDDYLDPRGRWWGGAPTLRGMRYYASDPNWDRKIAAIAAGLNLPTLTALGVRFGDLVARDNLRAGARTNLTISLDPGSDGLPAGLRFAVRFRPLSIGEADPATARLTALPGWLTSPTFVPPSAISIGSRSVSLTVTVPSWAGQYGIDAVVLDKDGAPLPDAARLRIGSAVTRVVPRDAVTYSAASVQGNLRIRTTNAGVSTIPAVTGASDPVGGRPRAAVEAWGLPLAGGGPILLSRSYLVADLAPGGAIDVATGDLESILPAVVVVSLRPVGLAPAFLGPPAVFHVEAADPSETSTKTAVAGPADTQLTLDVSRLAPFDPVSARLLAARASVPKGASSGTTARPAGPVTITSGPDLGLGPSAVVNVRSSLATAPVVRDAASAPRTSLPADQSGDATRVTLSLDAVPVGGSATDELLATESIARRTGPAAMTVAEARIEVAPDPAGAAAYLAVARMRISDARGTAWTAPQVFWLVVPGAMSAATGPTAAPAPAEKPVPKPRPKPKPRPRPAAPSYRIHIVVAGETLWSIAHRSGWSMIAIRRLNPWVDRVGLHPGDALKIPI
jgi:hypothetical protein